VITSSGSPCGSEAGPWPGSGRNHRLSSSGSRCSDSEASHLVEMLRFLVVRMSRPSKAVAAVSASKCVVPTRFGHPRVSSGRTTCPDASMSSSTLDELFTTRRDTPAGAAAPAWVQRPCWWSWCRAYGRSDRAGHRRGISHGASDGPAVAAPCATNHWRSVRPVAHRRTNVDPQFGIVTPVLQPVCGKLTIGPVFLHADWPNPVTVSKV